MTYSPTNMTAGLTVNVSQRTRDGEWVPAKPGTITTIVPGSNFFILEQGSTLTKFFLNSGRSQIDTPLMQIVGPVE